MISFVESYITSYMYILHNRSVCGSHSEDNDDDYADDY